MSKNRFIKSEEDRRHENIERLRLILKKINFIQSICKSFTNTALALSDEEMGRPSILMHLESSYEQLQKLQDNAFNVHEIFSYDDIVGFRGIRNVIAHDYEGIDLSIVEDVVENYLPDIKNAIENYLQQNAPNEEQSNNISM